MSWAFGSGSASTKIVQGMQRSKMSIFKTQAAHPPTKHSIYMNFKYVFFIINVITITGTMSMNKGSSAGGLTVQSMKSSASFCYKLLMSFTV